jgi:multiple sugar transport system substrate-binding protein
MIWASGGDIMTAPGPDQTGTFSASAPVAEALEFYQQLWQSGAVAPADQTEDGSTWGQAFIAGKQGIWTGFASNANDAEAEGVDVGTAPIPGRNGGFATFAGGDVIGIMASTKHEDAAWKFMEWYLGDEYQAEKVHAGSMPARTDMISEVDPETQPVLATQLEAAAKGKATASVAASAITNDASAPWLWACQQVIFEGAAAADVLPETDEQVNQLIKSAYQSIG